ncbi:hypothetical protein B0H13DRAFT_2539614 [Mycena leptocephala]|nr:hypothetical protein B0H13DRAFT_2539614 [Mycena leptocephala]
MAITRSSITRDASPTPSDNSNMYYEEEQVFYDEDEYAQSVRSAASDRDFTPTPVPTRGTSPASVVELNPKDFPTPTAPTQVGKANRKPGAKKGKGRAATPEPTTDDEPVTGTVDADANDPFLAADIALATAASLGLPTALDHASEGASSSRRPASAAGSPAKRVRANTAGDVAPPPFATDARTPLASTETPAPTQNGASPFLAPVTATVAAPPPAAGPQPPALPNVVAAAAPPGVAQYAAIVAAPPPGVVWMTADGNPPRGSYTPTPAGGYPDIVYSPTLLWLGVPEDLRALYGTVANPKFFLVVSGGNGQTMRTHALIRDAVGSFINIDSTDFQLGTPPAVENGPSPALWLVAGIPLHLAQAILAKRVLSSTRITIFPVPYEMPVNGFIGTYGGLTLPDTVAGAAAAQRLFQDAARANGAISQYVQTHRDAFGPQVSAEQAFDTFVASVRVRALRLTVNDVDTIAWQLHVTSPTNDYVAWNQLCHLFRRINVMTALHGTAYLLRAFHCHICPSVAHPTDLCPLPAVPGWLGPTPATIKALEDASRQAAIKAREHMRNNSAPATGGSNPRPNPNRGQGPTHGDKRPRKDGKGKGGGNYKGKGKRREFDDWY